MDCELLNYVNEEDTRWNVLKKGRTSMTRRPRKPGVEGFELFYHVQGPATYECKKSAMLKVVDAPSKKRRLLNHSSSAPPQKRLNNGEEGLSTGPQTPSVHHEESAQRGLSSFLLKSQKTKSKTKLRNRKMKQTKKEVLNLVDFSGIQLLADVACDSIIHEKADHVERLSVLEECTKPEDNLCSVDIKDAIVSPGSNGSAVQQKVHDNGDEVDEKKIVPSKGLRLHWDLNTVMDEWEDPCQDSLIEPVKHEDASISVVPLIENGNVTEKVGSSEGTYESITDVEVMCSKEVTEKTPDGESSTGKSEVDDSLTHPAKCEDMSTSTTSILKEQVVASCESDTIDGPRGDQQPVSEVIQGFCDTKVTTEIHVSECCSNEQGHMAEGDSEDKTQVDYDSPFEDGELREPFEAPEKKALCEVSDNLYKYEIDPLLEKVNHGRTLDNRRPLLGEQAVPRNEIEQGVQVDTLERDNIREKRNKHEDALRPIRGNSVHIDESTSFDRCRSGEHRHQSRSSNIGDYSMRVWDSKTNRSLDRNYSRNYNSRGGGYRTQDRRPSPSERNNEYGSYRGPSSARGYSGDKYRYHSQEYQDAKPCYLETKPHVPSNFSRPGSHVRSRSGSPIAWHFQKRKNLDTSNSSEIKTGTRGGHVSPERSSKCFDDHRVRDAPFRDSRQAYVTTIQQKQRYDPVGYSEKLKPDDYFRFNQRSARFSETGYRYKDNNDDTRKHDYYEKVNRMGRVGDDGMKRFRYARNRE